jgi:hypothetical protein
MEERRKHQRRTFSDPNRPLAELQFFPASLQVFTAQLKDIGEGGIGFIIQRAPQVTLDTGTRLILRRFPKSPALSFLQNLPLEIVWLFDFKSLEQIAFGCRFIEPKSLLSERIRQFVSQTDPSDLVS